MSDLHERLLAEIDRHSERCIRQDTVTCPCGETATATIHMDRSGYGPSEWIAFDHGSVEHRFDADSMFWQAAMDATSGQPVLPPPWAALKAIVTLHFDAGYSQGYVDDPDPAYFRRYSEFYHCCGTCGTLGEYGIQWPCATIRAVADALGVDE